MPSTPLADTPDVWVTAVSPVYETDPVDCPEGSKTFLNAVVLIDTALAAPRLMDRALAIEDAFDRMRTTSRTRPRTLDVDLVIVGDRRSDDDSLRLPHPRAAERAFVLRPWHDLEPDAVLPDAGPVSDLLDAVDQSGMKRRDDLTLELQCPSPADEQPSGEVDPRPPRPARRACWLGSASSVVAAPSGGPRPDETAPLVTWLQPVALFFVAAVLGATAWATWRAVHVLREWLEPHRAVNRFVLARSCALVGALVAGGYAGYALSWLGVDAALGPQRILRCRSRRWPRSWSSRRAAARTGLPGPVRGRGVLTPPLAVPPGPGNNSPPRHGEAAPIQVSRFMTVSPCFPPRLVAGNGAPGSRSPSLSSSSRPWQLPAPSSAARGPWSPALPSSAWCSAPPRPGSPTASCCRPHATPLATGRSRPRTTAT